MADHVIARPIAQQKRVSAYQHAVRTNRRSLSAMLVAPAALNMEVLQAMPTDDTVVWHLTPQWRQRLPDVPKALARAAAQRGAACVVKDGPHRTVYRVDLPQAARTVYLKHYRCHSLARMIAHALRGSTARREWHKARELARRRIPTVQPVGIGERKKGPLVSDNYFVSEAVPEAITLEEYGKRLLTAAPSAAVARQRRLLCEQLAEWTAKLHRSGVDHHDFHAGNILLSQSPARHGANGPVRPPRLLLIDLPEVVLSRPLNLRRSMASLAMLGAGVLEHVSRSERFRFLKIYLRHRDDLPKIPIRHLAGRLDARMFSRAQRVLRSRDKRALRTNRDFVCLHGGGTTLYAVRDLPSETLRHLLRDPEAPLRQGFDRPLKLSQRTMLVESTIGSDGRNWTVAYKRCRPQGLLKRWLYWARPSAARRSWQLGHALLSRGIATARPLAMIQPPRRTQRSYLATAWIAGGQNLHLYLWQLATMPPATRRLRLAQTAESLGRLVGRMHRWSVSHRDLKGCNLMVVEHRDKVESLLVDVDGARLRRRLSHRVRVKNLARLAASIERHPWVSHTVRLRFLKAYLRASGQQPQCWKPWWRRIRRHADRHLRRFRRRNQPVA